MAIAVSGGGDSLALMHLMADFARIYARPTPVVVTVDHALRLGSEVEAQQVTRWAAAAGLESVVLTRKGAIPASDIEAKARQARFRLIGRWCLAHGIETVCLAHTLDDQAETFLMRLLRGSGVDGLAAMQVWSGFPLVGFGSLRLWRPLMAFSRETLRDYLAGKGQPWIDDPMNEDPRFTRVRLRQAWPTLQALGFDKARLADTAAHLARARQALEGAANAVRTQVCHPVAEGIVLDATALAAVSEEIGLRVLVETLSGLSGRVYRPRFERLERVYRMVAMGAPFKPCTLHGCRISMAPKRYSNGRTSHFGAHAVLIAPEPGRRLDEI